MIRERDWFCTRVYKCDGAGGGGRRTKPTCGAEDVLRPRAEGREEWWQILTEERWSEIYKSLVTRRDGFKLLKALRRRELSSLPRHFSKTSFAKRGINFSRGRGRWRESMGDRCILHETLLSGGRMDRAARVPRDKWREKSKREISRDEERNEVVPSDGWGGF